MNKEIKGNVKSITTGKGAKVNSFDVDSLVLCNGWEMSSFLKTHLWYSIPLIPAK